MKAFSLAQASGYGMFSILLMIAVICEGVPMHLLVQRWSHVAAWILTAVAAYSFVWIVGLYRSLERRPVLIGAESVVLQIGSLWRVEFPRSQIRSLRRFTAADVPEGKRAGYVALVVLNDPQWLIELNAPVVVHGPGGVKKTATRIAVAVDDGEGFGAALGFDGLSSRRKYS